MRANNERAIHMGACHLRVFGRCVCVGGGGTIRHGFALGPLGESMVLDKGVRLIFAAPVRAARRCLSFLLLLHLLLWLLLLLLLRLFLCLLMPLLLPTATPSCHTQALHPHPVSK